MRKKNYILLNGLKWAKRNLKVEGKEYFTFDEAQELIGKGKRVPTREEYEALCELPNVWDAKLRGRWFAEEIIDLGNPDKSLFMPASGYRYTTGALDYVGTHGYYWSASPNGAYGYCLYFYSSTVSPANLNFGIKLLQLN